MDIVFRAAFAWVFIVFVLRVMGRRELSSLSAARRGSRPRDLNRSQPGVVQPFERVVKRHDGGFSQAPVASATRWGVVPLRDR